MTALPNALVNGFATGVVELFAKSAKGLDPGSQRFVARRPYERILSGFLTPVRARDDQEHQEAAAEPAPDESYEQTNIGFEWCLPLGAIGSESSVALRLGFNTFVRVLPSYSEARDNARFRQGIWRVSEVWERVTVADVAGSPLTAVIPLSRLAAERTVAVDLEDQMRAAWLRCYPTLQNVVARQRHLDLQEPNLASEEAFDAWARGVQASGTAPALAWRPLVEARLFPSPTELGCARVLMRIVNRSEPADARSAPFSDPRLYAVDVRAEMDENVQRDMEFRVLPNSYRYDRRVQAIGINCQPRVERHGGRLVLQTETVPTVSGPRIVPREIVDGAPRFELLAREDSGAPVLRRILRAMREYDSDAWRKKVEELVVPAEREDAEAGQLQFAEEIRAFKMGLDLLDRGGIAARSFQLMNETMKRLGRGRRRPFEQWHLFQIVFIVSMLPRLIEDSSAWASGRALNLLWFPAGGGKTEAFLGVLVWHAFYDRLRGKALGTTAMLRYPLRLLTYQQLQRLSRTLGKAEEVRLQEHIGGEQFSVGYLVGESTTPNRITDEHHRGLRAAGVPSNWQRIFACPTCDHRSVQLRYNEELRLVEHYCARRDCPSQGARLPIYICDDDLYCYLPTVIVSTVDKLAGLGQNRRFSQLFGRISLYCPRHGAAFRGSNRALCGASKSLGSGQAVERCGTESVQLESFRYLQPSLHIQDELHLLRESLATFDSHYETAAMATQRALANADCRWTLIGSTATIEGYREQARHLYLAEASRFPGPGPEAYDSFYYRADNALLGRIFVGVLGVGRTHTPAVARAIGILHSIVETVRRQSRSDLAGARQALGLQEGDSEQLQQLAFYYEVVLTYVLTRKGGDQVGEAIDSRVRAEIEHLGDAALRLESFNSSVDMPRMIGVMEEIESCSPATPLAERVRGVVATNIISHGVDIDRFNIMVFAGLPRQFAEYIQASARVGRQLPGIALLMVTPQAERDRSVLDRFDKFHEYVDRLVEPVPINRWSEPALNLTLRGILAAYLMGIAPSRVGRELYFVKHIKELFGHGGVEALSEAAVTDWVAEAVGAASDGAPESFVDSARRLAARLYGSITGAAADSDDTPLNIHLQAMRSLRDIDDPGYIRLPGRDAAELRKMGM